MSVPNVLPTTSHAGELQKSLEGENYLMDQEMGQDLTKHHHIIHDYTLFCTHPNSKAELRSVSSVISQADTIHYQSLLIKKF